MRGKWKIALGEMRLSMQGINMIAPGAVAKPAGEDPRGSLTMPISVVQLKNYKRDM
jgi:hypothetical protein